VVSLAVGVVGHDSIKVIPLAKAHDLAMTAFNRILAWGQNSLC
jgi:hypothetical protein